MGDLEAVARVVDAQDTAWWGSPDGDIDDMRGEFDRAERAAGSLAAGGRVAVDERLGVVGVALVAGHGHTSVAVDPAAPHGLLVFADLVGWLADHGGDEFEVPVQDAERLAVLADAGFVPVRSSFELERSGGIDDLPDPQWPDDVVAVPFRIGDDDEELHDMIYSFWTDVPGHTSRPIDEWRASILAGPWFEPDLIVVARTRVGLGPIVGCALGRMSAGDVGWVSQLGVAHSARGCGLGRAILIEVCRRLGRREPTVIGLGVEAVNDTALGLYRSAGFEIVRHWMHCERPDV